MAVKNQLAKQGSVEKKTMVEYEAGGAKVMLTPAIVRNYLVSGDKDRVSEQEIVVFMNLCRFSGLNPWLKEAYCIKYGSEPATLVVGKEAFQKRAEANPAFDGAKAGIITADKSGVVVYREGTMKMPGEEVIGGWAEVWRKDRGHSTRAEVSFDEYVGRKKDGSVNAQWSRRPATMIRKVALVHALREAFPNALGGMYAAEEQGQSEEDFNIVQLPDEMPEEDAVQTQKTAALPQEAQAGFGNDSFFDE